MAFCSGITKILTAGSVDSCFFFLKSGDDGRQHMTPGLFISHKHAD